MIRKLIALSVIALSLAAESGYAKSTSLYVKQTTAVMAVFCDWQHNKDIPCELGKEAVTVSSLETRGHWQEGTCYEAKNGQYHGCFQMGSSERAKYQHGFGVWAQARAAFAYFVDSGRDWSPWSCKPWGYCLT